MSGLTSGGLGSSGNGPYGGIYSFFSTGLTLSLQATDILQNLDQITFKFFAGTVIYSQESIKLDYNLEHSAIASTQFSAIPGTIVDTPIGEQSLTAYTWTWSNLSSMSSATNFNINWNAIGTPHAFITDISVVQAIPEPSTYVLLVFGVTALTLWKARKTNSKSKQNTVMP
jgi:hypothetical protein